MFIEGKKQLKEKKQNLNLMHAYFKYCQGKTDFLCIGPLTRLKISIMSADVKFNGI